MAGVCSRGFASQRQQGGDVGGGGGARGGEREMIGKGWGGDHGALAMFRRAAA